MSPFHKHDHRANTTIAPGIRVEAHALDMAYNFVVADRDQRFLLPPTCGSGCRKITSLGS